MERMAIVAKQLCPEPLLQGLDLLGNCRLGKMQLFRGNAVIHRVAKGKKCVQPGIHIRHLDNISESSHSVS